MIFFFFFVSKVLRKNGRLNGVPVLIDMLFTHMEVLLFKLNIAFKLLKLEFKIYL